MTKLRILAACLEALCLEGEISFSDVFRHPSEHAAEDPVKIERQGRAASGRRRLDPVMGDDPKPWGDTEPGEALARLNRRDLPQRRRKSRLTDHHSAPDGERASAEALDAGDRWRPFVPSVGVAHHLPHPVHRRGDFGRNAESSHGPFAFNRRRKPLVNAVVAVNVTR